jgi:hypothetical protein
MVTTASKEKKQLPKGCAIAIAIVTGIFFIWIFTCNHKSSTIQKPEKFDVIYMAHYFISERLKSPKSADFSNDYWKDYGDSTYLIYGSVDATNSFNANIRSKYSINLRFLGGDKDELKNWEVEKYSIE